MFPLIFLWILRLTVAVPHGIIFTRSPSQFGHFPISAKNVNKLNFASDIGKRTEKKISAAISNFDTRLLASEYAPQIYQPPLYQDKSSHVFRDLLNKVSPLSIKRTDLHLLGQIPNSVFNTLVGTSSLEGVPIVEDYSNEGNIKRDSQFGIYQNASEFSLQSHEQTKKHPLINEVIYGTPSSLIDQLEFFHLPDPIYENNFLLPTTQPKQQLSDENDLGFSPEYDDFEDYSDGSILGGVSSLVSQPLASQIPWQYYQSQQIRPETLPLNFGARRDSVPLSPHVNAIIQNIPSRSHDEANLPSQQYVSFGGSNYPPPSTAIVYEVPTTPTTCRGSQVLSYDGICVEPNVIRSIYSFSEPKDDRFPSKLGLKPLVLNPKVKLNLVVIKANEDVSEHEPLIIPTPREKTVILVLKKEGEKKERKVIEIPAPAGGSPEVFFVNYKDGENPTLPGGIDLLTALASSAKLGEGIRSSFSVPTFEGYDSNKGSNYEGQQH